MGAEDESTKTGDGQGKMSEIKKLGGTIVIRLRTVLSIILALLCLFYVANVFGFFAIHVPIVPYLSAMLMLVLVLTFLTYPVKKNVPREKVPWYDILLIVMSVCAGSYITFFSEQWTESLARGFASPVEIVLCFVLVACILEGTRRTMGIVLPLVALFFILHLVFGPYLPGPLRVGCPFSLERIAVLLYMSPEGVFSLPVAVAGTVFLIFMYFAGFLQKSEAGDFITDGAFAVTGAWTGGPAKAAIAASSALGTVTGAGPVNVAATGSLTIPLMKKTGYKPEFAGAVEAVASDGGILMPPVMGAAAFIMAELLGMPYWSVCVAAFVPALLYYVALFTQVHFEAVKLNLRGLPREQLPSLAKVMREGWFYLLPLGFLVYLLAVAHLPAQHAGLYTTFLLIPIVIISWEIRKTTRKSLRELIAWLVGSIDTATEQLLLPFMACAAAGIVMGCVGASGIGFKLSLMLLNVAQANLFLLLLLVAIVSFVLGMGVPALATYIVLAVLVAPALIQLGVQPIAAHLFVFYWGITSLITPPVAISAFVAAGIAGADPFKTGFQSMRLGFVTFVYPFMFVYKPGLLLIGSIGEIALAVVTGLIATFFLACAAEGFFLKKCTWLEIALFGAGGLLLMMPGLMANAAGGAIVVLASLWQIKSAKRISHGI